MLGTAILNEQVDELRPKETIIRSWKRVETVLGTTTFDKFLGRNPVAGAAHTPAAGQGEDFAYV